MIKADFYLIGVNQLCFSFKMLQRTEGMQLICSHVSAIRWVVEGVKNQGRTCFRLICHVLTSIAMPAPLRCAVFGRN